MRKVAQKGNIEAILGGRFRRVMKHAGFSLSEWHHLPLIGPGRPKFGKSAR